MRALLAKLSWREKVLVTGAAVFVGSALFLALVINPAVKSRNRYGRMVQETRRELAEFSKYAAQYRALQSGLADLERQVRTRSTDMSLLAVMENNARKLGLADRIASMKPFTSELESGMVQSSVEIRVEKVDLSGLVRFIEAIETGPQAAITTKLRIKARFDDPALLDATLLASTLEKR